MVRRGIGDRFITLRAWAEDDVGWDCFTNVGVRLGINRLSTTPAVSLLGTELLLDMALREGMGLEMY
ncbi:MAG: hypothetical protein ABS79_00405 [Planctomycetes bacterium SCN 63-9]|nr:MAG: hypothetical protein ABS79_00405 [Planctomycetes bacterium SCN 63-9]